MTLLSNVVKIADKVTKGLKMQVIVTHKQWTTDAGKGDPSYKTTKRSAVVSKRNRQVRSFSGELVVSSTTVTFVGPVPVNEHDVIVLPDGSGGPVIGSSGPVDESGQLIAEAYLG